MRHLHHVNVRKSNRQFRHRRGKGGRECREELISLPLRRELFDGIDDPALQGQNAFERPVIRQKFTCFLAIVEETAFGSNAAIARMPRCKGRQPPEGSGS